MKKTPKYYIVEASALPEVFLKVAEAKRLLSTGEAATVNEAAKMTDISRSAFYKYRDAILPTAMPTPPPITMASSICLRFLEMPRPRSNRAVSRQPMNTPIRA